MIETETLKWMKNRLNRLSQRLNDEASRKFPLRPFQLPAGERIISFTFDDVPDTAESAGARILEKYSALGTFYIAGGLVETSETQRRLISAEGCRRLAARGHDIGCHTFAHLNAPTVGREEMVADLDRNDAFLQAFEPERTGPRNFAYPYCASSVSTRRLFSDRFATCRGGGDRINRGMMDLAFLQAVEIKQPDDEAERQTRWIDDVTADPGWLIFYTHDVSDTPTPFGCKPATFERLVAHAAASGAVILSVREALAHIGADRGAS
ncbi:polysaccharide deacetylase family protein [Ochrobactrum sp. CM-21-5]|nr:polysaccharide deacetylase family protein [Ochrobactrum sp. CM-21-5]MBC2884418.1 polysaccharide deacetylase family protein [Ochrobactrum sp. CM-21-5]